MIAILQLIFCRSFSLSKAVREMSTAITCVELNAEPGVLASALADPSTKIVHLVRHGQATHNLFAMSVDPPACGCSFGGSCVYRSVAHVDARLTKIGRKQAVAAGAALLKHQEALPEVFFASPLTRTLETAAIAARTALKANVPKIIADERLRERYGVHITDKRSPKEQLASQFPVVDFDAIHPGQDALYQDDQREHPDHVAERSYSFFVSLRHRSEKTFAVFAHSAFYRETLRAAFLTPNPSGTFLTSHFWTADARLIRKQRCMTLPFSFHDSQPHFFSRFRESVKFFHMCEPLQVHFATKDTIWC